MNLLKLFVIIILLAFVAKSLGIIGIDGIEGWGTSPGTFTQLSASSSYYPFWQYGYGYRYPYYRYMYPSYNNYLSPYNYKFPRPYGTYKYY